MDLMKGVAGVLGLLATFLVLLGAAVLGLVLPLDTVAEWERGGAFALVFLFTSIPGLLGVAFSDR